MKHAFLLLVAILLWPGSVLFSQDTVTDFDGNVYHTIAIGSQVWLKENITSMHYTDGTVIPDVVAYNNSDSLAQIFGRLYTWDAAMKNVTTPGAQGVCPNGWHVPSSAEYAQMENFLGGAMVAGGAMKDTTQGMWTYSATAGATNSSGFTALPAGEYDAHQYMAFQLLHEYAVFWTSTQTSALMATERYLEYNSAKCLPYNWYKVMKYSIRCVRDFGVGINETPGIDKIKIMNPVKNYLRIITLYPQDLIRFELYNFSGELILQKELGNHLLEVSLIGISSGIYLAKVYHTSGIFVQRVIKTT